MRSAATISYVPSSSTAPPSSSSAIQLARTRANAGTATAIVRCRRTGLSTTARRADACKALRPGAAQPLLARTPARARVNAARVWRADSRSMWETLEWRCCQVQHRCSAAKIYS
eukprot:PLAT4419.3.p1 GENE.PLAT4419.3~~PLAT4419.3.p1  ORF type:complete len:114 (+),score=10.63 PLAT4419.3:136-477(+)